MPDNLSDQNKLERYKLLLKSRSCTPFWGNWILRKIDEIERRIINREITYLMNPSQLARFKLDNS